MSNLFSVQYTLTLTASRLLGTIVVVSSALMMLVVVILVALIVQMAPIRITTHHHVSASGTSRAYESLGDEPRRHELVVIHHLGLSRRYASLELLIKQCSLELLLLEVCCHRCLALHVW